MTSCTATSLQAAIAAHGGVLRRGEHTDHNGCCILEARSVCLGLPWTDDPETVGLPDLRPLNDAPWSSNGARTAALVPVALAYDQWAQWEPERRQRVVSRIVCETVRLIVAELPGLPEPIRQRCREVTTLQEAAEAARAAAWAAAWAAAQAAVEAAEVAWAAAWERAGAAVRARAAAEAAARAAAGLAARARAETQADAVLQQACAIWIAATEQER